MHAQCSQINFLSNIGLPISFSLLMNRFVNDHRTEAWLIASIEKCMAININRRCLVRFTHFWYQIFSSSWLGSWHLPQFILSLGNHIVDLWGQNWGQHSGFSEENHPKIGFFWKLQKMKFPAFGFKNWDFFWVGGLEKGLTNFFSCQKA